MPRLPVPWREPFRFFPNPGTLLHGFDELGFGTGYGNTDMYEKDGQLHYDIELPGLKKEDIKIRVEGKRLIVTGDIQRDESIREDNYLRMERRYGRFQKSFLIPEDAEDLNNLSARFENGILKITVPLKESLREQGRDIPIE